MAALTLALLPAALQQILSRKTLGMGELLFQQGDAADHLYWVNSGQMRLVSFVNQQMITHYFVETGELLGETALLVPHYGCTAMAENVTEVIAIPVEEFRSALGQDPILASRYLEALTRRFLAVKSLLELRSINSARDRLLHYLLQRRRPGQTQVLLDKPFRAIASELALSPESLSRLLSRLQIEGVLRRKQRIITFSQEWLDEFAQY